MLKNVPGGNQYLAMCVKFLAKETKRVFDVIQLITDWLHVRCATHCSTLSLFVSHVFIDLDYMYFLLRVFVL